MTNLFHNHKEQGVATLLISVMLVTLSTLIIIFAANYGLMLEKITANQNRNGQAFQAAEAGLEFGINYLQQNASTILANPVNGYIPAYSSANTQNVTLTNGSKFTIAYSNPIQNNYTVILIASTGTSSDGSTTDVVSQQVSLGSLLATNPSYSLTVKGQVDMSSSAVINNLTNNQTVLSGGETDLSGSAKTVISTGTSSTAGNIKSDIQQNSSTLQNQSQSNFFATFFGSSNTTTVQNNIAHYYSNSSSTDYSSTLNGMTGTSIWIDQTGSSFATMAGNTTIGSAANPVLLVVNGNLLITGNVTIYGFVYVIGSSNSSIFLGLGNISIIGGVAAGNDSMIIAGNSTFTYNTSVLNNLRNQTQIAYWAKIPGTWRDF